MLSRNEVRPGEPEIELRVPQFGWIQAAVAQVYIWDHDNEQLIGILSTVRRLLITRCSATTSARWKMSASLVESRQPVERGRPAGL